MMLMKNRINRNYLWVPALILLLVHCNTAEQDAKDILKAPPYKGLTDSISRFPQQATLYQDRAVLLSHNNQHELASADYKKNWELAPAETSALLYISNLLLVDEPREAIRLLNDCIKKYPDNPEFRRRLSEVYAQTGNDMEALRQFDLLIQQDSLNFESWYEKGNLLARMGDTTAATAALERSWELQPISYTGIALANLYAAALNPKVIPLCDFMISKDSTNAATGPFFIKGMYYSDSKKYTEALAQFDECIKRDWKFIDAYLEKGILFYEQQSFSKAMDVFRLATTVSNTNPDAWFWIGRCYEATGDTEHAIENYERAISLDKNFTEAKARIRNLKG